MIKQLVSFGCSWAYGDELVDPTFQDIPPQHPSNANYRESHSFPGLIAQRNGWTHKCLAEPGSSNISIKWSVIDWLENASKDEINESILLVGLTSEMRTSWYNPGTTAPEAVGSHYIHSTALEPNAELANEPHLDEWKELNKLQRKLIDCTKSYQINYSNVVRTIDGISARFNIPTVQVKVLTAIQNPVLPTLIQDEPIQNILHNANAIASLVKPLGHPNEEGHKLIASYLQQYIEEAQ